jgi:hypothetical protein
MDRHDRAITGRSEDGRMSATCARTRVARPMFVTDDVGVTPLSAGLPPSRRHGCFKIGDLVDWSVVPCGRTRCANRCW